MELVMYQFTRLFYAWNGKWVDGVEDRPLGYATVGKGCGTCTMFTNNSADPQIITGMGSAVIFNAFKQKKVNTL